MKPSRFLEKQIITSEADARAAIQKGVFLSQIPDNFRTPKVCLEAVEKWGPNYGSVPYRLKKSILIATTALRQDRKVIEMMTGSTLEKMQNTILENDNEADVLIRD